MSKATQDRDSEVDYDVGASDIETQNIDIASLDNDYLKTRARQIQEEQDVSEQEAVRMAREEPDENDVEAGAILSIVADSIYSSSDAPIREYIANAETACLRAARMFDDIHSTQPKSEYQPTIQITWERDENRFTIQDNGIGIGTQKMQKVVGFVGRTDVLDTGEMSGMWGMGMYSWFGDGFAGQNGVAKITTHSRETDEDYSIVFTLGDKNEADEQLGEDIYGTRVSGVVNDPDFNVRSAVKRYAEWSRVKVSYREFDENGNECYNEEWGRKSLSDNVEQHKFSLEIDNEAFKAVCYPSSSEDTLLVSMPIDRNLASYGKNKYQAPYAFDVRIKQEGGQIANGWARGLVPIAHEKYEKLSEQEQENYVSKQKLDYEYVALPTPTTDRDRLNAGESEEFIKWVSGQLRERFNERMAEFFDGLHTKDDIQALSGDDFSTLKTANSKLPHTGSFESEYDADLTDEAKEYISKFRRYVQRAPRSNGSRVTRKSGRRDEMLSEVLSRANGGDVYMGQRINHKKAKVVWDMDDNNVVVQMPSSKYDEYQNLFGWKLLKDIDLDDLGSYDISDSLKKDLQKSSNSSSSGGSRESRKGKNVGEKKVNISTRNVHKKREKIKAEDLETILSTDDTVDSVSNRHNRLSFLMLFPSSHDESHTDNTTYAGKTPMYGGYTAVASCTNEIYDYLKHLDRVVTKEEYLDRFDDVPVRRFNGSATTVNEVEDDVTFVDVSTYKWRKIVRNDSFDFEDFKNIVERVHDVEIDENDILVDDIGNINAVLKLNGEFVGDNYETVSPSLSDRHVRKYVIDEIYFSDWDSSEYPKPVRKAHSGSYRAPEYYEVDDELAMFKNLHDKGFDPEDITDKSWEVERVR